MPSKKILLPVILAILIIGGVYFSFFYGKIPVSNPVPKNQLNNFSSDYFPGLSFNYPTYYSVQDYSKYFKVLTVSKDSERRIEIFRSADFGARDEGNTTKEQFTIKSKNETYNVWLFYPDNDAQAKSELHQIYNSIDTK
ncbi:MAG: hypothetical protein HYT15_03450 [Candidatus Magasanikbacteria bacterium]|nr:hypothetical protein [Candidatus Magasanikbacteria bacterium]